MDDAELQKLLGGIFGRYRALGKHKGDYAVIQGKDPGDGRQLESYPPEEDWNPIPGKATTELYNTSAPQGIIQNLIAGDMLHHLPSVDPQYAAMKKLLLGTMTPEQTAMNRKSYERQAQLYEGTPPPFDQWMDSSRGDEFIMGALFPDAADNWKKVYTPGQRKQLGLIGQYLIRGSIAPGFN